MFTIPPRSEVGLLDPEIAGEGQRVIHSDGDVVSWTPPPAKPVMPDWSGIKSIARYFNRTGHQVWPAWLYSEDGQSRLVKDAHEAGALGVCYREATQDERARYGHKAVWDWEDGCKWRPQPWKEPIFDPHKPGPGKTYQASEPNPVHAQNDLVRALIPEVAAAVAKAMQGSGAPSAPANINPADWEAFQQFLAFKKTAEAVDMLEKEVAADPIAETAPNALSAAMKPDGERERWEEEATTLGIKVDGRWSLDRLKSEVEKHA